MREGSKSYLLKELRSCNIKGPSHQKYTVLGVLRTMIEERKTTRICSRDTPKIYSPTEK